MVGRSLRLSCWATMLASPVQAAPRTSHVMMRCEHGKKENEKGRKKYFTPHRKTQQRYIRILSILYRFCQAEGGGRGREIWSTGESDRSQIIRTAYSVNRLSIHTLTYYKWGGGIGGLSCSLCSCFTPILLVSSGKEALDPRAVARLPDALLRRPSFHRFFPVLLNLLPSSPQTFRNIGKRP